MTIGSRSGVSLYWREGVEGRNEFVVVEPTVPPNGVQVVVVLRLKVVK